MRPSDRAWLTLAAAVLTWDVLCPPGEMLSEASARYTAAHRIVWPAAIIYTAGHLMHVWPNRFDLFALTTRLAGR